MDNNTVKDEYLHYLEKVCSDYCLSGTDVYNILISKNDERFPLSFETIKYMVLKNISIEIIRKIFTHEELKSILENTNMRKIKNVETRNFINTIK